MILKKIILILLIPLLFIIYLYFIFNFTYNNLIISDFKFNNIKNYQKFESQLEKDIMNTNTFNNIINEVLSDSFKSSFFGNKSLESSELLQYIDKNLSSLTSELRLYRNDVVSIRSTSYIILKDVYSSMENSIDIDKSIVDDVVSNYSIRVFSIFYCIVLIGMIFASEKFNWLKYNGICMILTSFIFYSILFILKSIFSIVPLYIPNIYSVILSKALNVNLKYLIIYLMTGFVSILIYYLLNKFLFSKNKN